MKLTYKTTTGQLLSGLAIAALLQCSANAVLIHHWDFNDGTGTIATDVAGANNGTLNGGVVWAGSGSGYDNSGYTTYNGSSSFVSTGYTYDPDGTYTWAAWVNSGDTFTDGASNGQRDAIIIGNRRDGTGAPTADFTPREFVKFTPSKNVFRPDDTAFNGDYTNLVIDTWTHLAVVKDGSTFTFYENGVAGAPVALTKSFTETAMPFFIGGEDGNPGGEFFTGDIDEVRIYDNALTAGEVLTLATTVPEPSTSALFGLGGLALLLRRRV